jgi:serine/threonine protein kinase
MEVVRQTLGQVAKLHAAGWMHRDLKPHNILIEDVIGGFPLIRLCDLGACKDMKVTTTASGRAMLHAPYNMARFYRAPELLCGSATYTVAADMWGIAVTLAEVATIVHILRNRALSLVQHRGNGCRPQTGDTVITSASTVADPQVVRHVRGTSSFFHGATNDGAQLVHIINLLGLPTRAEVADMRLHPLCQQRFLALAAIIAGRVAAQTAARPPTGVLGLAYRAVGMAGPGGGAPTVPHHPLLQPDGHSVNLMAPIKERFDFTKEVIVPASGGSGGSRGHVDLAVTPLKAGGRTGGGAAGPADGASGGGPGDAGEWMSLVPGLGTARLLARMGVPAGLADVLAQLLRWGPSSRLTAEAALRHPALVSRRAEVAGLFTGGAAAAGSGRRG